MCTLGFEVLGEIKFCLIPNELYHGANKLEVNKLDVSERHECPRRDY
jgi:hypothetical protein